MIGMDFISFLILLVISAVVSGVIHYGLNFYVTQGLGSFCSKIVVGWVGAWLGTPVLGHWFAGVQYQNVYIIPAVIGAAALLVVAVDIGQMLKGAAKP